MKRKRTLHKLSDSNKAKLAELQKAAEAFGATLVLPVDDDDASPPAKRIKSSDKSSSSAAAAGPSSSSAKSKSSAKQPAKPAPKPPLKPASSNAASASSARSSSAKKPSKVTVGDKVRAAGVTDRSTKILENLENLDEAQKKTARDRAIAELKPMSRKDEDGNYMDFNDLEKAEPELVRTALKVYQAHYAVKEPVARAFVKKAYHSVQYYRANKSTIQAQRKESKLKKKLAAAASAAAGADNDDTASDGAASEADDAAEHGAEDDEARALADDGYNSDKENVHMSDASAPGEESKEEQQDALRAERQVDDKAKDEAAKRRTRSSSSQASSSKQAKAKEKDNKEKDKESDSKDKDSTIEIGVPVHLRKSDGTKLANATVVGCGDDAIFKGKPVPAGFVIVTINSIYKDCGDVVVSKLLKGALPADKAKQQIKLSDLNSLCLWPVSALTPNTAAAKPSVFD